MKKFLASLLVLVIAIALVPQGLFTIDVHAATSGDFTYTVSNGEATITDFPDDYSGALIIPSTLDGYPVTSIGNSAFRDCDNLTSVTIPRSITYIGFLAFYDCDKLTSIIIPDSVTSIDTDAFGNCYELIHITVDVDNIAYCSVDGVLFNKDKTTLIQYPAKKQDVIYHIPDTVLSISNDAFRGCENLTSVTIPNSVISIGRFAFIFCYGLTSVIIPKTISISDSAFGYCYNLKSVGYASSESDRSNMTIERANDYLLNATWYYNYCGDDAHTYTNGCDMDCNTCQWPRTGEHTYDNSLDKGCNECGHTRTFEEFPITAISAEPKSVIEKTNGWWATDYNNSNQTCFQYYYNPQEYTITMADGLTFTGHSGEISDLVGKSPYEHSDQSAVNPWGLGDHAVTLTLGAITGEYIITVIENPIQSITAEPVTVVEGTHCYWTKHYINDEEVEWLRYSFEQFDLSPSLTLTMKDGSTVTGRPEMIYHQLGVYPSFTSDQSYENQWSAGTHTVTVSIGEMSGTFPYIITESPIESISAAPITLYENINGSTTHDWQTDIDYFQYNYYSLLNLTIIYKDGTSSVITAGDCYNTLGVGLSMYDDQSSTNPWGFGAHKATVRLGHLSCQVDITVEPNPVENIELIKLPKTQYITGEYLDLTGAVLRVHFNDGTSEDISIEYYHTYPGISYYYSNKLHASDMITVSSNGLLRDRPAGDLPVAGKQTLILTIFGKSTSLDITVTEKKVQSLSVDDENHNLVITITYTDNTSVTMNALGFSFGAGDTSPEVSMTSGRLHTDKGIYAFDFIFYNDGSVYLRTDGVTSNKLENGCDWYEIYQKYHDISLPDFDGKITAENIDYIIMDTIFKYGYRDGVDFNDDGYIDGKTLKDYILSKYVLDSIDLSLSSYYDSETDRYHSQGWGDTAGYRSISNLTYKNGYWEMTWVIEDKKSYARFDDDGRILRISNLAPIITYGDPTDDMIVDSRDLVLIRKFMANFDYDTNTSTVDVAGGADTNGDGVIDARDLVLLRQYFANYDYDSGSSSVVLGPQN